MSHKTPFLYILILWIAGLLFANLLNFSIYACFGFLLIALVFRKFKIVSDICLMLAVFFCSSAYNKMPQLKIDNGVYEIQCVCTEVMTQGNVIVESGNHKFYLKTDTNLNLFYGNKLLLKGKISEISNASNIYAFSYWNYLKKKGVYHRIYPIDSIQIIGQSRNLIFYALQLRKLLLNKTDTLVGDKNVNAFLKSVVLGYRNDMEAETRDLFEETGTVHLLAVSGLHTSAVYCFINFLMSFFGLKNRKARLLVIPVLWAYAFISGLSPSVVRAAQILSFILLGDAFTKDFTPVNSLAASAFFSLLLDKYAIFSLSMQMSYAAYTGIILIFPLLKDIYKGKSKIIRSIYELAAISISAQITTLPLCVYYFHFFSLTSFIINIAVVPLTSYVLYIFLTILCLPTIVGSYFVFTVEILYYCIIWLVSIFRNINVVLTNLYPTVSQIICGYLLCFALLQMFLKRNRFYFRLSVCMLSVFIGVSLVHQYTLHSKCELIVFNLYRESCVVLNYKGFYQFIVAPENDRYRSQYMPYIVGYHLGPLPTEHNLKGSNFESLNGIISCSGKKIRIFNESINTDTITDYNVLIITDNITPDKVFTNNVSTVLPEEVILDGSNSRASITKWQTFCDTNKIRITQTSEDGSVKVEM
ncbi:MAG: ComEC family competence protein [Culturomica sp.]|nr:ComEC family competence protein [Culturomica sp.]